MIKKVFKVKKVFLKGNRREYPSIWRDSPKNRRDYCGFREIFKKISGIPIRKLANWQATEA